MRRADIQAAIDAGDEVAVKTGFSVERAQPVEAGVERGTAVNGHTLVDGVRVRFLDREVDAERVVRATEVRLLWRDHAASVDAEQKAWKEQDRLDREATARRERAAAALGGSSSYAVGVMVPVEQAEALAAQLLTADEVMAVLRELSGVPEGVELLVSTTPERHAAAYGSAVEKLRARLGALILDERGSGA